MLHFLKCEVYTHKLFVKGHKHYFLIINYQQYLFFSSAVYNLFGIPYKRFVKINIFVDFLFDMSFIILKFLSCSYY